jgi:hypothetical protein
MPLGALITIVASTIALRSGKGLGCPGVYPEVYACASQRVSRASVVVDGSVVEIGAGLLILLHRQQDTSQDALLVENS